MDDAGAPQEMGSYPLLNPNPVLELTFGGSVSDANPSALRLFPSLSELGPAHPLVAAILPAEDAIAAGGREAVQRQVAVDGRHYQVSVFLVPGTRRLRAYAVDDTERQKLETQMAHADRMVAMGTLAAGVGHELNNPLAYICANLDFALDELVKGAEQARVQEVRAALAEAREGAQRCRVIVSDLRTLSRDHDSRVPVDVRRVLDMAMRMLEKEIARAGRLEKDFGPVPAVLASEARLGQVVLNLMLNAAQALSPQHCATNLVRLATRTAPDGRAVIEVQDSGPGIAPEVLPRIFEPFFTTKPIGVGTGLGLSICHSIVTQLGGEITVDSALGQGTLFRVLLPPAP